MSKIQIIHDAESLQLSILPTSCFLHKQFPKQVVSYTSSFLHELFVTQVIFDTSSFLH